MALGQPIDYSSQLTGPDPGAALTAGYQGAIAQTLALAQQHRALQQQANLDAARQAAVANPSAKTFNALMVLDPQNHEAFKQAWDSKDKETQISDLHRFSAVRGFLQAGSPEIASQIIQRGIDADKAAGRDTKDDEDVLSLIKDDPDAAKNVVDYHIASAIGPDKWESVYKAQGDANRADQELPSKIAQNQGAATASQASATNSLASAGKTNAETVEVAPNAQVERDLKAAQATDLASQIDNRAGRLSLDRDALATNTNLKLEEMANNREIAGSKLSGPSEQQLTSAVLAAESSKQLSNRAGQLAEQLEQAKTSGASGGWGAVLNQGWTASSGKASPVRELRRQYEGLMVSQAIKNLPPGPASDKDVKLAQRGFPDGNADIGTMQSFLRGMAKLQDIAANRDQARADWISENGNLGKAKRDLTVNGVKVPAGANWLDFSNSQSAIERRDATVQGRSYMRHAGQ